MACKLGVNLRRKLDRLALKNLDDVAKRELFKSFSEGNDSSINTIRLLEHLGIKDRQSSRYEEYKWFSKTIKRYSSFRKIYQNTSSYMISFGEFWEFLTGKPQKEVHEAKSHQLGLKEGFDSRNSMENHSVQTVDQKALIAIQRYQKPGIATERREIGRLTGGLSRLSQDKENEHPTQRMRQPATWVQPGKPELSLGKQPKDAKSSSRKVDEQARDLEELRTLRADLMTEGKQHQTAFLESLDSGSAREEPMNVQQESDRRRKLREKITASIEKIAHHLAGRPTSVPVDVSDDPVSIRPPMAQEGSLASSRTTLKGGFREVDSVLLGYTSDRKLTGQEAAALDHSNHIDIEDWEEEPPVAYQHAATQPQGPGSLSCISDVDNPDTLPPLVESTLCSSRFSAKEGLIRPLKPSVLTAAHCGLQLEADLCQNRYSSQTSRETTEFQRHDYQTGFSQESSREFHQDRFIMELQSAISLEYTSVASLYPVQQSRGVACSKPVLEGPSVITKTVEFWISIIPELLKIKPMISYKTIENHALKIRRGFPILPDHKIRIVSIDHLYVQAVQATKSPTSCVVQKVIEVWEISLPKFPEELFVSFNERSFRRELHKVTTNGSLVPLAACASLANIQVFGEQSFDEDLDSFLNNKPRELQNLDHITSSHRPAESIMSLHQIPALGDLRTQIGSSPGLKTDTELQAVDNLDDQEVLEFRNNPCNFEAKQLGGSPSALRRDLEARISSHFCQNSISGKQNPEAEYNTAGFFEPEVLPEFARTQPSVCLSMREHRPTLEFSKTLRYTTQDTAPALHALRLGIDRPFTNSSLETRRRTLSTIPMSQLPNNSVFCQRRRSLLPELDSVADKMKNYQLQRLERAKRLELISSQRTLSSPTNAKLADVSISKHSPQPEEKVFSPLRFIPKAPDTQNGFGSNGFFRLFSTLLEYESELHKTRAQLFQIVTPREAETMLCAGPTISCATLHQGISKLGVSCAQRLFTQFWASRFKHNTVTKNALGLVLCGHVWKSPTSQVALPPPQSKQKHTGEVKKLLGAIVALLVAAEEVIFSGKQSCSLVEIIDFVRSLSRQQPEAVLLSELQMQPAFQNYPADVLKAVFDRFKANAGAFPLNAYSICLALS